MVNGQILLVGAVPVHRRVQSGTSKDDIYRESRSLRCESARMLVVGISP